MISMLRNPFCCSASCVYCYTLLLFWFHYQQIWPTVSILIPVSSVILHKGQPAIQMSVMNPPPKCETIHLLKPSWWYLKSITLYCITLCWAALHYVLNLSKLEKKKSLFITMTMLKLITLHNVGSHKLIAWPTFKCNKLHNLLLSIIKFL